MAIRKGLLLGAAGLLLVGFGACDSGDDTTGGTDPEPSADKDGSADDGDGADEPDTAGETDGKDPGPGGDPDAVEPEPEPAADPCETNPCTHPPATGCDDADAVVTYKAEGTCTNVDGDAKCEYVVDTTTPCGEGMVCGNGACQTAGDPTEYAFAASASILTALVIPDPDDEEQEPCCFDFDGDEAPDNGLGKLITQIGGLLGADADVNTLIAEQVTDGSLTILFEETGLDDATADTDLTLNGFFGALAEGSEPAESGNGTFTADPASFIPGTATPLIAFAGASIEAGVLAAGPSLFALNIPLADFGFTLSLSIQETQISADSALGPNGAGLALTNGKLGGLVPLQQIADALNGLGASCLCMGLDGEALFELASEEKMACTAAFKAAKPECTEEADGQICSAVSEYKGVVCPALGIFKPDIDTDDSGKPDSFSIGIQFEATSATISGLTPEEAPAEPAASE